jgi:transcriptional regulator with XRE-family HTH domain
MTMHNPESIENGDIPRRTSLRKTRLSLDITQEQMAQRMGISRSRYSQLENGRGLTTNFARKIAAQTGQTVGQVFDEYEALRRTA